MTHWMQTYSRVAFEPLEPKVEQIRIADIAHALSNICRFGGHTKLFYSVAEHSVHVSVAAGSQHALAGLLHDAAEAYLGDLVRPIKHLPDLARYRDAEDRLLAMILEREGLEPELPEAVKWADNAVLAAERDHFDLIAGAVQPWADAPPPARGVYIGPWPPAGAKQSFLQRYRELGGIER